MSQLPHFTGNYRIATVVLSPGAAAPKEARPVCERSWPTSG